MYKRGSFCLANSSSIGFIAGGEFANRGLLPPCSTLFVCWICRAVCLAFRASLASRLASSRSAFVSSSHGFLAAANCLLSARVLPFTSSGRSRVELAPVHFSDSLSLFDCAICLSYIPYRLSLYLIGIRNALPLLVFPYFLKVIIFTLIIHTTEGNSNDVFEFTTGPNSAIM